MNNQLEQQAKSLVDSDSNYKNIIAISEANLDLVNVQEELSNIVSYLCDKTTGKRKHKEVAAAEGILDCMAQIREARLKINAATAIYIKGAK